MAEPPGKEHTAFPTAEMIRELLAGPSTRSKAHPEAAAFMLLRWARQAFFRRGQDLKLDARKAPTLNYNATLE